MVRAFPVFLPLVLTGTVWRCARMWGKVTVDPTEADSPTARCPPGEETIMWYFAWTLGPTAILPIGTVSRLRVEAERSAPGRT